MKEVKLNGVTVAPSFITQRAFGAAYCDFLLPITNENLEAQLDEFRREGTHGVYKGLKLIGLEDISFIEEFPNILYLEVISPKVIDTEPVKKLRNLRGLLWDGGCKGIDFSYLRLLETFIGDWDKRNVGLSSCKELRTLRAWKYKNANSNLTDLKGLTRLERLCLTQTNICSLEGISLLEDLRYLEVSYAPQLTDISALAKTGCRLRELELDKVKGVKGKQYEYLSNLKMLRNLTITSCGDFESLDWLTELKSLDKLDFYGTDVTDGSLEILDSFSSLSFIRFKDKKHFNRKLAAYG
jgi:Leucine-rich repeat (LRR) protein